jgi:hypothetical protein
MMRINPVVLRLLWPLLARSSVFSTACLLTAVAGASQAVVENLQAAREKLEARYVGQLEELARWCQSQGLDAEAQRTRRAAVPRDPWTLYLVTLPTIASPPEKADKPLSADWQKRFDDLGRQHAQALLPLARQAMRAKHPSLAYELVLETLRCDPDNEQGRKLLGFIKYKGQWRTPFEVEKLRAHYVWHPRFGWLPQSHVARYEAGQRYYNGRWITAAEEADIRSDLSSAWHVETEHYSLRTNHSLEAGVELGQQLERLYRAWQQTFAAYYASPEQLLRLFEGRGGPREAKGPRHLVVYFRNREEYVKALKGHIPDNVVTTGIYLGDYHTAYFYAGKQSDHTTLYHEASHQLFSECREVAPNIGLQANFWIVEGIACYMESFQQHDAFDTLGGTGCPRLEAARFRLLEDNFYLPLEQLVLYGIDALQRDPRIAMLYSQSAGLAHFLMHFDGGRYRDALMSYLEAIYTGQDGPDTLAQLTGKSLRELDSEYREFLKQLPMPAKAAAR